MDSVDGVKLSKQKIRPCTLAKATQELVSLIFSNDMFKEAMQTMNIGKAWSRLCSAENRTIILPAVVSCRLRLHRDLT